MQTEIYFIRHAEPNYNNHDDLTRELTPKGLIDRELVTNYLADKNIEIVLSSPYIRAVDTVKHFADKYNMDIEQVEDFRERKIDSCWIEDFVSIKNLMPWIVKFTFEGDGCTEIEKIDLFKL